MNTLKLFTSTVTKKILTFFEEQAMALLNTTSIFEGTRFVLNSGMEVKFSTVMMLIYMVLTIFTLPSSKANYTKMGIFVDALESGAKMKSVFFIPARDRIGRAKDVPTEEYTETFEDIRRQMAEELAAAVGGDAR